MTFATPRRILTAGWLFFGVYAYPGFMQTDGADQLVDSRVGEFTDWHSPMMTEVWRILGRVIAGPAGMLFLQSLLLLGGGYMLLRRVMSDRAAAFTAVGVLVFPPIIAIGALVSPEAQLAAFLVASSAMLASERRDVRLGGLGLIVIACGMRNGASLAALPIVVALFRWDDESKWRRRGYAIGAWVAAIVLAAGIDRVLVDKVSHREEVALAMTDIVGTLSHDTSMSDAEVREVLASAPLANVTELQQRAKAIEGKISYYAAGDQRIFERPDTEAQRLGLIEARRSIIRAAPGAYLAHRWRRFTQSLGFSKSRPPLYTGFVDGEAQAVSIRHRARHSMLQSALIAPVRWLSQTPLFRPYVYFIVALALLPLAAVRRHRVAVVLLASAIAYEITLMFSTIRPQQRDSHWMIVATAIAIALLVARSIRGGDYSRGTNASTR